MKLAMILNYPIKIDNVVNSFVIWPLDDDGITVKIITETKEASGLVDPIFSHFSRIQDQIIEHNMKIKSQTFY